MQKSRCDAILLLSGGIDSTTVLEQLTKQGKKVFCLIFDYKQSLRKEIAVAASNAKRLKQPYKIVSIDLGFTGSKCSLISKSRISENRSFEQIDSATPTSYVEFRNGILLSYAVMFAEVNGINDIYGGFNGLGKRTIPRRHIFIRQGVREGCKRRYSARFQGQDSCALLKDLQERNRQAGTQNRRRLRKEHLELLQEREKSLRQV